MSPYDRKDRFYARAKAGGYRARSAYKLQELDDRYRLLQAGARVVDLGAWPGAWMQVVLERVGATGRVVGVDLADITPLGPTNAIAIRGDVRDPAVLEAVATALDGPADVVLCDVSPKLTGIRATDTARRAELAEACIAGAAQLLRPGGCLVMKRFMDEGYPATLDALKPLFRQVRTTKPEATRPGSSELYIVAMGRR